MSRCSTANHDDLLRQRWTSDSVRILGRVAEAHVYPSTATTMNTRAAHLVTRTVIHSHQRARHRCAQAVPTILWAACDLRPAFDHG